MKSESFLRGSFEGMRQIGLRAEGFSLCPLPAIKAVGPDLVQEEGRAFFDLGKEFEGAGLTHGQKRQRPADIPAPNDRM